MSSRPRARGGRAQEDARAWVRVGILLAAAAAIVVAALLVKQGGTETGSGPGSATQSSTGASPSTGPVALPDFCRAFDQLQEVLGQFAGGGPVGVADLQDEAEVVQDLGRRTVMPRTALAGLEYVLGLILALDDTATADDLVGADAAATVDDNANAADFAAWQSEACPVRPSP